MITLILEESVESGDFQHEIMVAASNYNPSNMNEELEKILNELYNEFWRRLNIVTSRPSVKGRLDGGKSPENEVLRWYQEEYRMIKEEFGEK